MKKVRELLSPIKGRKAVVFQIKGQTELFGFSTDKEVPYLEDPRDYFYDSFSDYRDKNNEILNDNNAFYYNIKN